MIEPGGDPVARCGELWAKGEFVEFGATTRDPVLTACIGKNGAIEVLPGPESVCANLSAMKCGALPEVVASSGSKVATKASTGIAGIYAESNVRVGGGDPYIAKTEAVKVMSGLIPSGT